ncbi:hypothetical protein GCM10022421_23740 [Oceanisphaera sediminis]|uniref:Sulfotransferase family protein n=1 Tax=Oceanisphaera sediminis TaxID=981381 RepID=A0ABP7ED44_9GAMM
MPIFTKNEKNILFIHIPKSAGSSIERIGNDLGWRESFSIRGKPLSELSVYRSSFQHLHAQPLSEILNLDAFDSIFTVVRNPFIRFKSEYYWQRRQHLTSLGVDEWVEEMFSSYYKNSYIYDNHIRPQIEFIPKNQNVNVFKLEGNATSKARDLFLSFRHPNKKEVLPFGFFPESNENEIPPSLFDRHEKKSTKDNVIEASFEKHYDNIVRFYKDDFFAFGYKI